MCICIQFQCTDISWNSTGSVIAVRYVHLTHTYLCTSSLY